ncbi:winged helix-turn-helix domain-containing protein [Streptomyces sp. NPDC003077]|uniref:winged helix-turn-helix domain-containing protein n=1 Tax=Streptomyces sp. NPDC003077 TaxID=3154443 RepID=UPI0033B05275
MTNVRTLPATSATASVPTPSRNRQRLRAVSPDDVPQVAELLASGATWLPAPQHSLPVLPGHPPMVGYLVLVPADQAALGAGHPPSFEAPRPAARPGPGDGTGAPSAAVRPAGAARTAAIGVPGAAPADPALRPEPTGSPGAPGAPVRIDTDQRVVYVQGRPLDLTFLEFELLAHLVAHPHRVHTRDQLVTTVWGYGHVGDGRTVDVHVARLRRKLGPEFRSSIVTVRRVGYKYVPSA